MQTKLKDGSVMVCGGCAKDAELRYVGEDGKRLCTVGLAVGRRDVPGQDKPETVWCNVQAWHNVASVLSLARKGDSVLVVGRLKTREHEGKQYTDLVAEYVSVCAPLAVASTQAAAVPDGWSGKQLAEEEDESQLPF